MNILVIKIYLESNSNSRCVKSTMANLFYFFKILERLLELIFVNFLPKYGFRECIGFGYLL